MSPRLSTCGHLSGPPINTCIFSIGLGLLQPACITAAYILVFDTTYDDDDGDVFGRDDVA